MKKGEKIFKYLENHLDSMKPKYYYNTMSPSDIEVEELWNTLRHLNKISDEELERIINE